MTEPRYPLHSQVWTWYEAFPDRTRMTQHEVISIYSREQGYKGFSNFGYRVSPTPRGAMAHYLDERWFTNQPPANHKPKRSRK